MAKACLHQFLGNNHSWQVVGNNIARALLRTEYRVDLKSTNGYEYFPEDLKPNINENLDNDYDLQISYTALKNFPYYLNHGTKNRIGIWNYETTILPPGFAKFHKYADIVCPSSQFAADIFTQNGIPKEKVVVLPHGINVEEYKNTDVYPLKTNKKTKILANIAQPHVRKNIDGLFEAFGKAFTKTDDVCLVCKISTKKSDKIQMFDVDFWKIWNEFQKKFSQHAEVEIITDFLPTMVPLYNAVDIVLSLTRAECFYLPGLEGMATNNIVIAPRWGGQLDFMNDFNSLLIDGKEIRAPKNMQYWVSSPYAVTFQPDTDDAAAKLQMAVTQKVSLLAKFAPGMQEQIKRLTWDNVVAQIIGLCK
jgi:glycosyltransferase involved in cell wall biosynthesis